MPSGVRASFGSGAMPNTVPSARPSVRGDFVSVGVHEVVPDAVRVAGEGDPPHRVRHVVVEAGEEAEAVLAGQRLAPAARRCPPPGCCAPCRRAPCARRRPPRSRARPARARRPGRPCRRRGRRRGCRARAGRVGRPGPAHAGVAANGGRRRACLQDLPPRETPHADSNAAGLPSLRKGYSSDHSGVRHWGVPCLFAVLACCPSPSAS